MQVASPQSPEAGNPLPSPQAKSTSDQETSPSTVEYLKAWESRILKDKAKWTPDFERMKKSCEFTVGWQWDEQTLLDDPRYRNNLAIRMVNQKVASLYARNPTVEVTRKRKLDFLMWDESVKAQADAEMALANAAQQGMDVDHMLPQLALLQDIQQGKQRRAMIDRVAKTLQILLQHFVDEPTFKEDLKQCVRRCVITGVAFGRVSYEKASEPSHDNIPSDEVPHGVEDLEARAMLLTKKLEKEPNEEDGKHEEIESIAKSLAATIGSQMSGSDDEGLPEEIVFDFPLSTSVFPDCDCRSLTNYTAANFIIIESVVPVDYLNARFNVDIKVGSGLNMAEPASGGAKEQKQVGDQTKSEPQRVTAWEVMNIRDKTHHIQVKGWREWVLEPTPFTPPVGGFYPVAALTFNSIEVVPQTRTSVYPPSDIDNIKPLQKEWNRVGDALRDQRAANAPAYVIRKGSLSDADKEALNRREPNQVIELESIPADQKPGDFIEVLQVAHIDPAVYAKEPLEKDMQYSMGMQEANIGPAKPNVTATVGNIAEQSRLTTTSSNVDDLDSFLTSLVRMAGEMCLRAMSIETVKAIVGQGAVWPTDPIARKQLLTEIDISIRAASSGRPNKAVELQNVKEVGPLLMQAIQMTLQNPQAIGPMSAMVEELLRRLDDNLDATKFFPVAPPPMVPAQQQTTSQGGQPGQPGSGQGKGRSPTRQAGGSPVPQGPSGPGARPNYRQQPTPQTA